MQDNQEESEKNPAADEYPQALQEQFMMFVPTYTKGHSRRRSNVLGGARF